MSGSFPWSYRWLLAHVKSAGPVSDAYLPLGEGLHVLYGRNGAGKSSILKALQSTWDVSLVMTSNRVREEYGAALPYGYRDGPDWFTERLLSDIHERSALADVAAPVERLQESECTQLTRELLDGQLWALDDGWLYPVARLSEDTPVATRMAAYTQWAYDHWLATTGPDGHGDLDLQIAKEYDVYVKDFWTEADGGRPFGHHDRPSFASLPMGLDDQICGSVRSSSILPKIATTFDNVDVPAATARALAELATGKPWPRGMTPPEIPAGYWDTADFRALCLSVEARANDLFGRLLLDAPTLRLTVRKPAEWLQGGVVEWRAEAVQHTYGDGLLPFDALSHAEGRWARIAIDVALRHLQERYVVLLLDEPELGLHRTAEAHLAGGLAAIAAERWSLVVVATHSPDLLDAPGANLHRVWSPGKRQPSTISTMAPVEARDLRELGLTPADLLRRHKTFLVVEGRHDEIVIDELLGAELRQARVSVVAVHGARNLSETIDSFMLFHYTDARVIALVDNVDRVQVEKTWHAALDLAKAGDAAGAARMARDGLGSRAKSEHRFLGQFFTAALEQGSGADRVTATGLALADILEYLPVSTFAPKATSWEEVKSKHQASGTKLSLKPWMEKQLGASFDDETVRRAARALQRVPADFYDLLETCVRSTKP